MAQADKDKKIRQREALARRRIAIGEANPRDLEVLSPEYRAALDRKKERFWQEVHACRLHTA